MGEGGGGMHLSSWSISLHVSLTLRVTEDTTFTTSTLSDEATSTVDTSRVELNELKILVKSKQQSISNE